MSRAKIQLVFKTIIESVSLRKLSHCFVPMSSVPSLTPPLPRSLIPSPTLHLFFPFSNSLSVILPLLCHISLTLSLTLLFSPLHSVSQARQAAAKILSESCSITTNIKRKRSIGTCCRKVCKSLCKNFLWTRIPWRSLTKTIFTERRFLLRWCTCAQHSLDSSLPVDTDTSHRFQCQKGTQCGKRFKFCKRETDGVIYGAVGAPRSAASLFTGQAPDMEGDNPDWKRFCSF